MPATWYPLAFSTAAASCRMGSLSVAWAAAASEPASLNAMAVRRSATWQRAPVVVEPASPAHADSQQAALVTEIYTLCQAWGGRPCCCRCMLLIKQCSALFPGTAQAI